MKKCYLFTLLCFILLAAPISASAATVLLDPGHGGSDPGAIGVTGLYEKEVNLDIALKVRDELQRRGYEVVMTRTSDTYLSLQERIEFANIVKPDILVSIHANAFHDPSVEGTIVLYYDSRYPQWRYPASEAMVRLSPESRKLALALLQGAVEATDSVNRGLLESSVYMVRMGSVPSALIETAFLSNYSDEQKLRTEEFRSKMAFGISNGIAAYLPVHFSDVVGHWAEDSILSLYELGIVQGNGRYYFPDRQLTRAEFVAILDRSGMMSNSLVIDISNTTDSNQTVTESVYEDTYEPEESEPLTPQFTDLPQDHWAYSSLIQAAKSGFIKGFPDGTIRPDSPISRAEVTVLIDRIMNDGRDQQDDIQAAALTAIDGLPFIDVSQESWYAEAVGRMYNQKLINGVTRVTFEPERRMSRAEAAVMIDRYIQTVLGKFNLA